MSSLSLFFLMYLPWKAGLRKHTVEKAGSIWSRGYDHLDRPEPGPLILVAFSLHS